jgi:hypothetical protein
MSCVPRWVPKEKSSQFDHDVFVYLTHLWEIVGNNILRDERFTAVNIKITGLLRYDAVQSGKEIPTFRTKPAASIFFYSEDGGQQVPLWYICTTLHTVTSQKPIIYMGIDVLKCNSLTLLNIPIL